MKNPSFVFFNNGMNCGESGRVLLEGVLPRPPVARLRSTFPMRRTRFALTPQFGQPREELL